MRLSHREFQAMNNPIRRFFQRHVELRTMRALGLRARGEDLLEIGCGSGYGAELLLAEAPKSYVGIDLMDEQIELARARGLGDARFETMDASDLSAFADSSFDKVVIFGILHHIPKWRQVIAEVRRVLRVGGEVYNEEIDKATITLWDRYLHFGHQTLDQLTLDGLEEELNSGGLELKRSFRLGGVGVYCARKVGESDAS